MPTIDIALASYNGEQYIEEQILSILANKIGPAGFSLGNIIVSDNMSTDRTQEIVRRMSLQYPNIELHLNEKRGVINNFNHALINSRADYVMLSDQDDIWLENKISLTLERLLELEQKAGKSSPLLVFTDLRVTNAQLQTISPSFFESQKIKPEGYRFPKNIFLSNVAPGCTMMINRRLLDLAVPVPPEAVMHDWWLILVASSFGAVSHLNEQTILYRQHGNNQVGAKTRRYRDMIFSPRQKYRMARSSLENAGTQAIAFRARYPSLPSKCLDAINYLSNFKKMSRYRRVRGLNKKEIENRTFFGTVILYLLALTLPRSR